MVAAILIGSTAMNLLACGCWNSGGWINGFIKIGFAAAAAGTSILAASHLGVSL